MGSQIGDADAARACYALAIDDEELIRNGQRLAELLEKIAIVVPTDAALPLSEKAKAPQHEASGTNANQVDIGLRCSEQVFSGFLVDRWTAMEQPSDNDDIIQFSGINEAGCRIHEQTAARSDGLVAVRHDMPLTADRTTIVAVVRRQPKDIHEIRQRGQRKVV